MFRYLKIRGLIHQARNEMNLDRRFQAKRELVAIGAPAIPALLKELDKPPRGSKDIWDVLKEMLGGNDRALDTFDL